ncbi:MAG: GGDEF domain-containing protein [Lachnospiraceae bacterium]|jgi:diguanylate cyclase (GGDEF)-like protein|nr:GGDEF domain-containing protein [Lachnospiraceae bacterium]
MSPWKKRKNSLSFRLPAFFVSITVVLVGCVLFGVYYQFKARMIDEYSRMAKGATALMAEEIDPEKVDDYLNKNFKMKEYRKILKRFYALKNNYPDAIYMYVYRVTEEGGLVIFDLESEEGVEADNPGDIYELDEAFIPYKQDLMEGKEVPILTGQTEYGYVLTYMRPVFDSEGNYQCHVCVDFSMDYLHEHTLVFIFRTVLLLTVVVSLVLIWGVRAIRRNITGPINKMSKCTENFKYETEEDRLNNIAMLEEINIQKQDEIGKLYNVLMSTLKESHYYMSNLSRARHDIETKSEELDQMSATAMRDSLTHVGSKYAYEKEAEKLTAEIVEGNACFAVVMVDANNLKYVNDTCGHKEGDSYIQGCCKIVCNVYKHSPVFRVGGDEFVAVLRGDDYENRHEKMEEVRRIFMDTFQQTDKEVWERYSASVGMADYTSEDESVEQVFKRADAAMYEYKAAFKEKYGSYR